MYSAQSCAPINVEGLIENVALKAKPIHAGLRILNLRE